MTESGLIFLGYEAVSMGKRIATFVGLICLHAPIGITLPSKRRDPITHWRGLYSRTRRAMSVWRKIEAHSRNHCCRGKGISIKYYECMFVGLVIQHSKRVRLIILSSVVSQPGSCFFFTLSHKWHTFRKNVTDHKIHDSIFYTIFVRDISRCKNNSGYIRLLS